MRGDSFGHDPAEDPKIVADAQGGAAFDSARGGDDQLPGGDERPGGVRIARSAQHQIREGIIDNQQIVGAGEDALIGTRRRTAVGEAGSDRAARSVGKQNAAGDLDAAQGQGSARADFQ